MSRTYPHALHTALVRRGYDCILAGELVVGHWLYRPGGAYQVERIEQDGKALRVHCVAVAQPYHLPSVLTQVSVMYPGPHIQ